MEIRGKRILVFLVIILFLTAVFYRVFGLKDQKPDEKSAPKDLESSAQKDDPELGVNHPFGRPVQEETRLSWEYEPAFQSLCSKHHISIRIAAFQTILPDPLPGEEYNIALAADILAGRVVDPGTVFSTNSAIGPRTAERGFKKGPAYYGQQVIQTIGGGICKIATTLYNVAILANLEIIERRAHSMLVPYVPPGQDATITQYKDFRFRNNTEAPIIIWADTQEDTLYIAFYSRKKPPKVTWRHEVINRKKTNTIYHSNPHLKPGEEKVILPGADGMQVRSWITIEYADGETVTTKLGTDYYYPMPRIIERNAPLR